MNLWKSSLQAALAPEGLAKSGYAALAAGLCFFGLTSLGPQSLVWATLCGLVFTLPLIHKILRDFGISLALCATTLCLLIKHGDGIPFLALIPTAWGVWALLNRKNGLETGIAGVIVGLSTLNLFLQGDQTLEVLIPAALALGLIAGGGQNRTAIAFACLLFFANPGMKLDDYRNKQLHKNPRGDQITTATACLLISPGIIPKLGAIYTTYQVFQSPVPEGEDAPGGHRVSITNSIACSAMWLAFLGGNLWVRLPKRPRKWLILATGLCGVVVLSSIAIPPIRSTLLQKVGRSETLSNRTPLWELSAQWIGEKPWQGWGGEVWSLYARGASQTELAGFTSAHGQSLYMDTALRYGLPALGLWIALLLSSTLHRGNNLTQKAVSFIGAVLPGIPDVPRPWLPSGPSPWPLLASAAATGDPEKPPLQLAPTKRKLALCAIIGLGWAGLVLLILPNTQKIQQETWIGQRTETQQITGWTWFAKSKETLAVGEEIRKTHQKELPTLRIHRQHGGNILTVEAKTQTEIETFSDLLTKAGRVFVRAHAQEVTHNEWAKKLYLGFLPLFALGLIWVANRPNGEKTRTLIPIGLILGCVLLAAPEVKKGSTRITTGYRDIPELYPYVFEAIDRTHTRNHLLNLLLQTDRRNTAVLNSSSSMADMRLQSQEWAVLINLRGPAEKTELELAIIEYRKIAEKIEAMPPADNPQRNQKEEDTQHVGLEQDTE